MVASQVQTLLFDLGGVVIDIDFKRALTHWQPISRLSAREIEAVFRLDTAYEQHERGQITGAQYFAHLREVLQLEDDPARIEEGWNRILIAEIPETIRLIASAREKFSCHAFSNSNPTHRASWRARFPAMERSFDRVFVSSDMGHRKPDRTAFEHVGQALGVPLESILFFDDLPENVAGAAAAGLQTVLVSGPADVEAALRALGCLPSSNLTSPG